MADDATEVPVEIKTEETQKAEEKLHDAQLEQVVKLEDTAQKEDAAKQEEPVEQELVVVKHEDVTKQGEAVADVKKEIENEGPADVKEEATGEKPTGRRYKGPKPNKSKFDPTVLPESDDPEEIRKQVEFYFSESNLSSDRFLFGLVGGKENKPVPLNLIVSFKRMRRFPNKETVINALKESAELELGGDAGEETVRRKVPLEITELVPQRYGNHWQKAIDFDPTQDQAITRSIYAKGFGNETATTQIEVEKFFEPYGPINAVRLRRTDTKIFKTSVFVEFANEELAQKFMALEKKPTWGDKELLWMTKLAYVEGKIQDIKDGKVKPKHKPDTRTQRGGNQNGGQRKHNGNRNGRDGNDRNARGGHRSRGDSQRNRRGERGRGGHNDRRGGDRGNKRGDREGFKKEDNGIPKIKSSVDVTKNESTAAPAQDGAGKRKATDDGAQEVKKPKVENTVA